ANAASNDAPCPCRTFRIATSRTKPASSLLFMPRHKQGASHDAMMLLAKALAASVSRFILDYRQIQLLFVLAGFVRLTSDDRGGFVCAACVYRQLRNPL